MANLTIKGTPPSVRDVRRRLARAKDGVAERARRRRMRETREEFERFLATLPRMSDSTQLIREDRDRLGR